MNEAERIAALMKNKTAENGAAADRLSERVQSLRLPPASSSAGSSRVPIVLCVLFGLSTVYFAWLAFSASPAEPAPSPGEATPAAASSEAAAPAKPAEGEIVLESKGYITPAHQILVSPKVSGMVVALPLEEGMRVEIGDVLAELESVDYQADVARAKATLALAEHRYEELKNGSRPEEIKQAEAELSEAEAQLPNLKATYDRNQDLRRRNAVSQQEFDKSESDYRSLIRRIDRLKFALDLLREGPRVERILAAEAEVAQAKAELAKAEWRLGNCKILAPISGTILKKNAEMGNIVNPVAFNGSFSLCEMADLSDLEVDLSIQERDVAKVFKGQKCRVKAEAFADRVYEGYVDRLMPIADRAKGAVPVRVKVKVPADEEGVYLKPEMGAIVTFYNASMDAKKLEPAMDTEEHR